MKQLDNETNYPITAEIIYNYHQSFNGIGRLTFLKCLQTGTIYKYSGNAFGKFNDKDTVIFKAKLQLIRNKPVKFKQVGRWAYDDMVFEFEYLHDIWQPRGIKKIESPILTP